MVDYYGKIIWDAIDGANVRGVVTLANNLEAKIISSSKAIIINIEHPLARQRTFSSIASANSYLRAMSALGEYQD